MPSLFAYDYKKSILSFLRIWSHLLEKSLMENFIFCAVKSLVTLMYYLIFLANFVNESPKIKIHSYFKRSILLKCFIFWFYLDYTLLPVGTKSRPSDKREISSKFKFRLEKFTVSLLTTLLFNWTLHIFD